MEDKNNILEVCRACLATGCKMFSMKQYNLEQTYALLTGISSVVFDETKMLQMVCFECVRRLQNIKKFSAESLTAWAFLKRLTEENKEFGEYVCDVCQSHFRKRALLVIHINKTHNKYISCRKCTFGTVFESTAIAHKNRHDGFRFQCKICPKHYSKRSTCVTHVRRCHPEDVVCHLCGASLPLVRDLDRHLRTTHRADELYLLPGTKSSRFGPIEKKKASSEYMAVTYSSTLPADASHCPACDIRFRDQGALLVHLSHSPSHGNPPKYKPSKSRGYTKKSYYEKKEAKLPVTYSCEQCGAQFAAYQSYHTHFRAEHPGQSAQYARTRPQFICEVCGKVYQTVYCLNDHRQSHSGQRAHSCAECGKTFTTKMALRTHRLDHTRSRECSVCGKVFSNVTNVQKHMRIHTRKPYACEPCNKRFCTPSERRAHIQHYHMGVPWPKRKPRGEGRREATLKSQADMEQATVEQNIQSAVKNLTPNTNFHSHFA